MTMAPSLPTWVISDTHFGHEPIRRYCNRPAGCDPLMVENWKQAVGWKDEILFLGDFSFADEYESEKVLKKLTGRVSTLKGDHDKPAILDLMRRRGWKLIEPFSADYRGWTISFTHVPLPNPLPERTINVHGHVHCHEYESSPRHVNVSVEVIDYRPQRLAELLDRVIDAD